MNRKKTLVATMTTPTNITERFNGTTWSRTADIPSALHSHAGFDMKRTLFKRETLTVP